METVNCGYGPEGETGKKQPVEVDCGYNPKSSRKSPVSEEDAADETAKEPIRKIK